MEILAIVALLFTKHFIVDFPLQCKYQWQNKGTYGHMGGVVHAFLHGLGTAVVFWFWAPMACLLIGIIDMFLHYHIDWAKMNLNAKMGWKPDNSEKFWWLLGADQFLHAMTYIWLVSLIVA